MFEYNEIFDLIFENFRKLVFPEEWLVVDMEMSKQELFSLMVVDKYGEVTMSQIADSINIPMSTATGIIERLVKKGYIIRDKNESDRRIVSLKLTDKGKIFIEQIKVRISAYVKKIYDSLDEDDREHLFKIFNKIMIAVKDFGTDDVKEDKSKNVIKKIEIE